MFQVKTTGSNNFRMKRDFPDPDCERIEKTYISFLSRKRLEPPILNQLRSAVSTISFIARAEARIMGNSPKIRYFSSNGESWIVQHFWYICLRNWTEILERTNFLIKGPLLFPLSSGPAIHLLSSKQVFPVGAGIAFTLHSTRPILLFTSDGRYFKNPVQINVNPKSLTYLFIFIL